MRGLGIFSSDFIYVSPLVTRVRLVKNRNEMSGKMMADKVPNPKSRKKHRLCCTSKCLYMPLGGASPIVEPSLLYADFRINNFKSNAMHIIDR